MSKVFPFQFGIVREDPQWEHAFFPREGTLLCIASAGDTALSLALSRPEQAVVVVDINPDQLALVERKRQALGLGVEEQKAKFHVGESAEALDTGGAFEALFATFASFVHRFVFPLAEVERAMEVARDEDKPLREVMDLDATLFSSPYWTVAFELAFSDSLLHAMFTTAATQHARDPYPVYFQALIERGLRRDDAATNPWLHHLFFGRYLDVPECWPPLFRNRERETCPTLTSHAGTLLDAPDLAAVIGVSLSNIFDWMDAKEGETLISELGKRLPEGARLIIRQLNSDAPVRDWLAPDFDLEEPDAAELQRTFGEQDRSLFYERALFATRRAR